MAITLDGTIGITTPGITSSANISGNIVAGNIFSTTTNPPTVRNSAGTAIGTFCRAWVKINVGGSSPTVTDGFNVSSITYNSTGRWTVNFTTALPNANYVGFVTPDGNYNITLGITTQTTTTCSIYVTINTTGGPGFNPGTLYVGFFG